MENRILIQLSLNEEEKPMYSWKTRMAKTAAAVLAGALALSGCGGGTGTTNAKGGPSVADTITAQVAYSTVTSIRCPRPWPCRWPATGM